jgi:hypothetical protein
MGFLCGRALGPTTLYAYRNFALQKVLEFSGPRRVLSNQTGGLVIAGRCASEGADHEGHAYCVRDRNGRTRDLVVSDSSAARVTVLSDGRIAVLIPPTTDKAGRLRLIAEHGVREFPLKLDRLSKADRALLERGMWLDGLQELASGGIATWVVGSGPFAGVRIDLDGSVRSSVAQDGIARATLNGAFGVVLTRGGVGYETTNYGFEWHVFKLPTSLSWDGPSENAIPSNEARGCSALGCSFGNWLRIGFGESPGNLSDPPEPARVTHFAPSAERWALECDGAVARSDRQSGRIVGIQPSERGASRMPHPDGQNLESSTWRRFMQIPAPPRSRTDLGLDVGSDDRRVQFRSYAWGPNDGRWPDFAQWIVRVADRFDLASVWSTAASRIPWKDPLIAAQAYGQDSGAASVDWLVVLEPEGKSGLLKLRARGTTELYLIEQDQPISSLKGGAAQDLDRVAGVVRVGGHWYVGSQRPNAFRIYRVSEGALDLVQSYPQQGTDGGRTQLVRSRSADALGILVKSRVSGWYTYPIDLATGEARAPSHLSPEELVSAPICDPGEQGWEVISEAPLSSVGGSSSNIALEFSAPWRDAMPTQLEAKLLISEGKVCVTALAAQVEMPSPTPKHLVGSGPRGFDPANDQRFGFRCAR